MQIAKLFASLGFKIDTADLSHFESLLNKAQGEMSQFAKDLNFVNQKLKTMKTRFGQANDALKDTDISKAADRVAKAVDKYVKNAKEIVDIDSKVEKVFLDTGVRLDTLSNKLDGGTSAWNRYEQQVKEATTRMREFTAAARERQSVNPPRSTNAGSGSNQGGSRGGSRGNNGHNDEEEGFGAMLLGGQKFGKAFVGQMAVGGLLGTGYIVKEIVQSGREVVAMEQKLKAVSDTAENFANNMQYVRETSKALAIDIVEFGNSFASIYQSAKSSTDIAGAQEMYTNFNRYFKALQMTPDQIKGSLRAIGQMFNKQQVMAEELKNQLGERAAGTIQIFAEYAGYGTGSEGVQKLFKAMEAGKVGVQEILKASVGFGALADKNNALAESLEMSASKQILFTSAMKEFSATILKSGLDKALAKMFNALTMFLEVLTPMIVGLIEVFKGLYLIVQLLTNIPLDAWLLLAANAAAALTTAFLLGGKAAIFAGGAVTFMASALRLLKAALPIAALMGLLWVLGEVVKWRKEQEAGNQTYTWIDLWIVRAEFFFKLMRLGWLNTRIAISESINAVQDFFTITPPKWFSDFIERRNSNPEFQRQIKIMEDQMSDKEKLGGMVNPSNFGGGQNLSIPVDVYLTIQNPDGSAYQGRATSTPVVNVGAMGLKVG